MKFRSEDFVYKIYCGIEYQCKAFFCAINFPDYAIRKAKKKENLPSHTSIVLLCQLIFATNFQFLYIETILT